MGSVSFNPSSESITLRLQVGGVDPDTFRNVTVALDTGATITIIPSQVLIALGYDPFKRKGTGSIAHRQRYRVREAYQHSEVNRDWRDYREY